MATICVKRGTTAPTTSNLTHIGELAYDYNNNHLYARSSASVVKIGGELEKVFSYEGSAYYYSLVYPFDPSYIYKVHVIASTYGTASDTSNTYLYYKTSSLSNLYGSNLNIKHTDSDSGVTIFSVKNVTSQNINDAFNTSVTLTSGISKVIVFEISPTFNNGLMDSVQWVSTGRSIATVSGQSDASICVSDFVHVVYGPLGALYINPGLNSGSPDSIAITIYRTKRK